MRAVSASVRRGVGLLLLLAVALPLSGCSKKKPLTPVAVKGRALDVNGKPLTDLLLIFHPQDKDNQASKKSAVLKEGGQFEIQCLPGRYRVTLGVIPVGGHAPTGGGQLANPGKTDQPQQEGIPPLYRDTLKSPWEITIPETGKDDIELRLEPMN